MRYVVSLSVMAALGFSVAAQAATVNNVSGIVSLNKGSGYKRVGSGASAAPGDVIMTGAEGSAQIVYANGCVEDLGPSSVVIISDAPTCIPGAGLGGSEVIGALATVGIIAAVVTAAATSDGVEAGGGGGRPASP